MRKILFLLLVCCTFAMNAQVRQVSGNQVGTWGGEIHITEDVIVPEGQTLTVDAGTMVISDFGILIGPASTKGESGINAKSLIFRFINFLAIPMNLSHGSLWVIPSSILSSVNQIMTRRVNAKGSKGKSAAVSSAKSEF